MCICLYKYSSDFLKEIYRALPQSLNPILAKVYVLWPGIGEKVGREMSGSAEDSSL